MYNIKKKQQPTFKVFTHFKGGAVSRKVGTMFTPKWIWYYQVD